MTCVVVVAAEHDPLGLTKEIISWSNEPWLKKKFPIYPQAVSETSGIKCYHRVPASMVMDEAFCPWFNYWGISLVAASTDPQERKRCLPPALLPKIYNSKPCCNGRRSSIFRGLDQRGGYRECLWSELGLSEPGELEKNLSETNYTKQKGEKKIIGLTSTLCASWRVISCRV